VNLSLYLKLFDRYNSYPGRNQAFAHPDGIHFETHDAKLANERAEKFFTQYLK